ncbi:MAG: peptidoglycan-binding protein [Oscillospiraceae bacterium]|nr:peptidoglycan-binding protein [Oscillospiraceae bacterium]
MIHCHDECGHQSQHYAGTAFDSGQALTNAQRNRLRTLAQQLGVWVYVEPANLTPTWVHTDRRQNPPACSGGGYPALRRGSRSVYVLILQDSLNTAGFKAGELDGVFGEQTGTALKNYQKARGLTADGVVGCSVWQKLTAEVVGKGRKTGTLD